MSSRRTGLRTSIIVIVVVALAVGGYLILRPAKRKKYKSTPAARGEILSQVSATGTVNPIDRVVVGTQVSGILDTVLVDFNDFVKAGQVLARIDPRSYQAALQQASANLTSAQLSLAQAQRDYVHAETLAKANLISGDQLFQAQTSCELARTKLEQGQASYDQAVTNLAYTTITAPMSGLVIARKVESGQTVAASFSAPELFNIADLSRMQVEVSIQEADVGKLDTGLLATFKVDAYPDQTFQGRLVQIRNEPITDQNVVTYIGIVRVDNPEFLLKPGMTADVKIEITHVQNVLVVPSSALNPKMGSLLGLEQARTGTGAAGRPGAGNTGAGARTAEGNPAGSSGTSGAQARAGGAHVARPVRGSPAGDSLPPGTKPAGGKTRTVYVLEKGVPAPRPVELGANDSYNTEIKSGLKEGELVILGLDQAKVNPFQQQGRPPGGGFR